MIETKQRVTQVVKKWLLGVIPVAVEEDTGRTKKVCVPAFHHHKMNTELNGQLWTLGTPFFYKYNVAYDRDAKPPAISFNEAECTQCDGMAAAGSLAQRRQRAASGLLRRLDAEPRIPV